MNFGIADYGINVWEGGNFDLQGRLKKLKEIGYMGIETLHVNDAADAVYKSAMINSLDMNFATCQLSSGNAALGIEISAGLGKQYAWLLCGKCGRDIDLKVYCRRANQYVAACEKWGIKAALHNHLGTCVETQEELELFMEKVPGAYLILDIAHLAAAGGDCTGIIKKYHSRIATIHFKDYFVKDPLIGLERWSERLRFCELGGGNDGFMLEPVAKAILEVEYDKWIFVEHDTHLRDPYLDLEVSYNILNKLFK